MVETSIKSYIFVCLCRDFYVTSIHAQHSLAMTAIFFVCICVCCFVQDKVGDFSGFTPDKLLLETEKALSNDTLFKPHTKLIELQDSVSLPCPSCFFQGVGHTI